MIFDPPAPTTAAWLAAKTDLMDATAAAATQLWDQTMVDPGDDAAADWVTSWAPMRGAGAEQAATLVDAYLDAYLEDAGAETAGLDPIDAAAIAAAVRPGVSDVDVAMRPVKQARRSLAQGHGLVQALADGRRRLVSIERTDVQQASRLAFRDRASREPAVRGYRRVLHGPENCALCVVASTQRYSTNRLMPIHPGCDCGVEPLVGRAGRVVDRGRLDEIQGLLTREGVAYGDRAQLRNTIVRINTPSAADVTEIPHGELGPLLGVRTHRHTQL